MSGSAPTEPNRPTLRQVAELSGVSLKTASRVFNEEQYVAPQTAARVRAAAAQLGFRPNAIARELRAGARSSLVGLIIGDVANPFYARIARGAERRLRDAGLRLISASTDEDPTLERELISDLLERRVSALLIVTCDTDHGYLQAERNMGTPLAFLDRAPADIDADSVVLDNHAGVTDAVRQLLAHGHRRIAFVGDLSSLPTHLERVAAFGAAVAEAAIADWSRYLRDGAHEADSAEAEVRALLGLPVPPTALLTANNRITIGALRALRGLHRPPALIGFDDFDLADLLGVTVIAHDPERMGELGAELLLDRLAGRSGPTRRVLLPTRLLARGSGERMSGASGLGDGGPGQCDSVRGDSGGRESGGERVDGERVDGELRGADADGSQARLEFGELLSAAPELAALDRVAAEQPALEPDGYPEGDRGAEPVG